MEPQFLMEDKIKKLILKSTKAEAIATIEPIQKLWSDYGEISRIHLIGSSMESIILKHIIVPDEVNHPRAWNSDLAHQRKLKSYQVEKSWYYSKSRESKARLPACLYAEELANEMLLMLEDLNPAGYSIRRTKVSWEEFESCISWLAKFHASYMGHSAAGLWPIGTYWHLATRPQELAALQDEALKEAAPLIEAKLSGAKYQTIVHGDAKLANFCFSKSSDVAGVDFQYVGGGCGMKDLAYFVGSCLDEDDCEKLEDAIVDLYFGYLHQALGTENKDLEREWRELYPYAWADFHRFLKGWSPDHWKINSYSERQCQKVIESLN